MLERGTEQMEEKDRQDRTVTKVSGSESLIESGGT